ncbi:MAG TPA: Rrf2 family transcriptional regulator [Nitrospiria bacterium]|nr:Rrf2 family transcriptional regulator [Nitrospiria bacterium]
MRFSAKGEYGVLAVFELANHAQETPFQAKTIAKNQRIPLRFLEQVLSSLRKAGLIESVRGAQGGYSLSRPPSEIRISDVLEAIEGPINPSNRASGNADRYRPYEGMDSGDDILKPIWEEARTAVMEVLDSITIQNLCERKQERERQKVLMYHI